LRPADFKQLSRQPADLKVMTHRCQFMILEDSQSSDAYIVEEGPATLPARSLVVVVHEDAAADEETSVPE
jgi:hypothetical protein